MTAGDPVRARRGPGLRSLFAVLLLSLFVLAAAACEEPDASNTTSPSARALLGLTSGNVAYATSEMPPPSQDPPAGWSLDLGNARFTNLENGTPALIVIMQLQSKPGAAMELWLSSATATAAKWFGGTTRDYDGTVCFQMRLTNGSESLQLDSNSSYFFTIAFRDPNGVILSKQVEVTHFPPLPQHAAPASGSTVFRDLLGCPRGG